MPEFDFGELDAPEEATKEVSDAEFGEELKKIADHEGITVMKAMEKYVTIETVEESPFAESDPQEAFADVEVVESKKVDPKITPKSPEFPIQIQEDYKQIESLPMKKYSKDEIKESIALYRYLMKEIIKPSDFQAIGDNQFLKRSGYRKIAQAFGISLEQMGEETLFERNEILYARVKIRALLGNRFAEGLGIIGMNEIKFVKNQTLHNLVAHAYTRAANRAIADLVGFGVVSATEVDANADTEADFILED